VQTPFREIYRQNVARVYGQLTRLVGAVPERDDLSQQVFLRLYHALPRFRGESALGTFIYRIVANVACDHRRRARDVSTLLYMDELPDPRPSPEAQARRRQELRRVFELLLRVTPKKRVAFVLVAVEGLSYENAAASLGVNVPAAKQRVLAARRELSALLADELG
jgi:RNA polymerase sigma-70 factor (ECF subfamily)